MFFILAINLGSVIMHEGYHLYTSQRENGKELAFYSFHGYLLGSMDILSPTHLYMLFMDVMSFCKYKDWEKFSTELAHSVGLML